MGLSGKYHMRLDGKFRLSVAGLDVYSIAADPRFPIGLGEVCPRTRLAVSSVILTLCFSMSVCAAGSKPRYRFSVIAETGCALPGAGTILSLGSGPSINDSGSIAFIARDEPGIHGRVIVIGRQYMVKRNFQIPHVERLGTAVQINNSDQVVWWRQVEASGSLLNRDTLVQRLDTADSGEIIARGTVTDWYNTIWDYVTPFASINNDGLVVFTGDLDARKTDGGTVLATRNGGSGPYEMTNAMSGLPVFFPMLSDPVLSGHSRIVLRFGNTGNDPIIVITRNNLDRLHIVADAADFNLLGSKPGISDDGSVVAFLADGKSGGPGVYMGVINQAGDNGVTFKLASIPEIESNLSIRVGVNRSRGDARDYTVVYCAHDANGDLTLYGIRVDVSNPFDHKILEGPISLVTVGEFIEGFEALGRVANIGLYDPINNTGDCVFWIRTDLQREAIVRASVQRALHRVVVGSTHIVTSANPFDVEYRVDGAGDAAAIEEKLKAFDPLEVGTSESLFYLFPRESASGRSRQQILEAIARVEADVKEGDLFVFFYSGHAGGGRDDQGNDKTEWIQLHEDPKDGTAQWAVTDDDLAKAFNGGNWSKVDKLFIFDCCYSGGFISGNDKYPNVTGLPEDLKSLPRTAVLAAAGEYELSATERSTGRGWFSLSVEEALDLVSGFARADLDQNGLTFEEIETYVRSDVIQRYGSEGFIAIAGRIIVGAPRPSVVGWQSDDFNALIIAPD